MPLGCHERPASAERKKPAVEPATQWPFTRERCRTLGPSSAGDDAPLAAPTTKMPLGVPMIAVFMLHLQDCPCVAPSGATIGPARGLRQEDCPCGASMSHRGSATPGAVTIVRPTH